jgi:hypothetical protein
MGNQSLGGKEKVRRRSVLIQLDASLVASPGAYITCSSLEVATLVGLASRPSRQAHVRIVIRKVLTERWQFLSRCMRKWMAVS